jgi:hypothetical protein
MFIEHVLPITKPQSKCSTKATIATNKDLGTHFEYLRDYLEGWVVMDWHEHPVKKCNQWRNCSVRSKTE